MLGVLAAFGGAQSAGTIVEVSLVSMGVGALFCLGGGVALAGRPSTVVRQGGDEPATARVPTWDTGLARPPTRGTSIALPILSGTF